MSSYAREFLQFELDGQFYGVGTADVERVIPAVRPTRLPKTPAIVEGAINLRGAIIPVLDIRARFRLQPKPTALGDFLIVALAGERRVAIRADRVIGLVKIDRGEIHAAKSVFPTENQITDIATLPEGVVLLHDLRAFLTRAEDEALAEAMNAGAAGEPTASGPLASGAVLP